MLIVFYVLLVWLKIIITTTVVFLWMWIARDRGAAGVTAVLNAIGALIVWAAPWAAFIWSRADLYQGHCGLRQGIRDCSLAQFLWSELRWARLGMLLDVLLVAGVLFVIFRARVSRGENSGVIGAR
jgi:hypothetical protein